MAHTEHPILVSTQWLAKHLNDPSLRLFDCTGCTGPNYQNLGREKHYNLHHIPGATYLDVGSPKGELTDPDSPLPFAWPKPEQFAATMARLGVDEHSHVVLYAGPNPGVPGGGLTWATRAWWLMHHHGIRCSVLDGGWKKWQAEGRPVSQTPTQYAPSQFQPALDARLGLALKADVLSAVHERHSCIVDSLSPESYRGEVDRNYGTFGSRKGHITGAVNVNYESVTDPATGCFLPPEQLRARFESAGASLTQPVITYCGGGIGATCTGFALKLLGKRDVRVYDGSLWEWANDPSLPMTDLTATAA